MEVKKELPIFLRRAYDADFGSDRGFRAAWGPRYAPPESFEHGVWHRIASLPRNHDDGFDVNVDEMRMPARFYRVTGLRLKFRSNEPEVFACSTGSSMEDLVVTIVAALRDGMLGLAVDHESPSAPVLG